MVGARVEGVGAPVVAEGEPVATVGATVGVDVFFVGVCEGTPVLVVGATVIESVGAADGDAEGTVGDAEGKVGEVEGTVGDAEGEPVGDFVGDSVCNLNVVQVGQLSLPDASRHADVWQLHWWTLGLDVTTFILKVTAPCISLQRL